MSLDEVEVASQRQLSRAGESSLMAQHRSSALK